MCVWVRVRARMREGVGVRGRDGVRASVSMGMMDVGVVSRSDGEGVDGNGEVVGEVVGEDWSTVRV